MVALLAAAACGPTGEIAGPGPSRGDEAVQTDALAYTAVYRFGEGAYRRYGFRLVASFRNQLSVPVYLSRCYPTSPTPTFGFELLGDTTGADSWGSAYNHAWARVGHDRQFQVAPGAMRVDTLDVSGPGAWQGGVALGTLNGRLRLRYGVSTCPGDGDCPGARELGASNTFDVHIVR